MGCWTRLLSCAASKPIRFLRSSRRHPDPRTPSNWPGSSGPPTATSSSWPTTARSTASWSEGSGVTWPLTFPAELLTSLHSSFHSFFWLFFWLFMKMIKDCRSLKGVFVLEGQARFCSDEAYMSIFVWFAQILSGWFAEAVLSFQLYKHTFPSLTLFIITESSNHIVISCIIGVIFICARAVVCVFVSRWFVWSHWHWNPRLKTVVSAVIEVYITDTLSSASAAFRNHC